MNLTAFLIAICVILAIIWLCTLALMVAEILLERKLVANGYSKHECKKDCKTFRKKKVSEEEEQPEESAAANS